LRLKLDNQNKGIKESISISLSKLEEDLLQEISEFESFTLTLCAARV